MTTFQNQQSFLWEMSTCDLRLWVQVEVFCQKGVTVSDAFQDSLTQTRPFLCHFPKSVEIVAHPPSGLTSGLSPAWLFLLNLLLEIIE